MQLQRLIDKKKTGNYAAARLEDGTVIIGRSDAMLAEEDLIEQAGKRKIVDLYSEREPCASKCEALTRNINVTWSYRWNGADRASTDVIRAKTNAAWRKSINKFFNSP